MAVILMHICVNLLQNLSQGWYALATSSQGQFRDTAEIYTPKISHTGPQCTLQFFYYMDGPSVDSLSVSYTYQGYTTTLWEISGGSTRLWQPAEIYIGAKEGVVIRIQSRRGRDYQGAIAVDDLQFLDCQPPVQQQTCRSDQFSCSNKYCIDPTLQCNYANDCGDKSDEGVCYIRTESIFLTTLIYRGIIFIFCCISCKNIKHILF